MFSKSLLVALAFTGGLGTFVSADGSGVITSTRVFNNFQGGEPLTLITTINDLATPLAPLPPGVFLSTIPGNHGPPDVVTQTSVALPPGVYLTTIPVNHAPPQVYTRTSSVFPTTTITTTNTVRSTVTVTEPTHTVTVQVFGVSAKPSLITGLCYWGQGGIEIPCTYTAGNLPNNVNPTAVYASNNGTKVNGSAIITTTPSSAAVSSRGNPIKYLMGGAKNLAAREALDPVDIDWDSVNNVTFNNASEPEFNKYQGENGVHWAKCDHVPIIWGPLIMAILFLCNGAFIRFKWNKPSRSQNRNGRLVIILIVFWGAAFPLFVYLEVYTSIAVAWKDCVPDPNRTYPL
ncbi:hypothetical protein BKA61DRAFT_664783 [Leptodontidium sp. MPI-SDFR-AT-0119]|nr:hypothetical protein BKA61DRAFT_664783 [Leptodontidium sp. MPI-SDFR-AT-0119]